MSTEQPSDYDRIMMERRMFLHRRFLRQRQRRLQLLVVSLVLPLAAFYFYYVYSDTKISGVTGVIAALGVGGFTAFFFFYLGDRDDSISPGSLEFRLDRLENQLDLREEELKKAFSSIQIGDDDKKRLLAEAKRAILDSAREEVLHEIRQSIARDTFEEEFCAALSRIPQRLEREITALRRRSNVNLFFGIVLGLCGLAMLWTVAFRESSNPGEISPFLLASIPRVSLALLTEFLAYFFLSLYKVAAHEIRYFHNEMTNQEARAAALLAARKLGADAAVGDALRAFLSTERNFILTKGQTTVQLEEKRLEFQSAQAAASKVEGLAGKLIDALRRSKD